GGIVLGGIIGLFVGVIVLDVITGGRVGSATDSTINHLGAVIGGLSVGGVTALIGALIRFRPPETSRWTIALLAIINGGAAFGLAWELPHAGLKLLTQPWWWPVYFGAVVVVARSVAVPVSQARGQPGPDAR